MILNRIHRDTKFTRNFFVTHFLEAAHRKYLFADRGKFLNRFLNFIFQFLF